MYSLPNRIEPPISDSGIARHQSFALGVGNRNFTLRSLFRLELPPSQQSRRWSWPDWGEEHTNRTPGTDGSQTVGFSERTGWILSVVWFRQAWWNRQGRNCADAQLVARGDTGWASSTIRGYVRTKHKQLHKICVRIGKGPLGCFRKKCFHRLAEPTTHQPRI